MIIACIASRIDRQKYYIGLLILEDVYQIIVADDLVCHVSCIAPSVIMINHDIICTIVYIWAEHLILS